MKDNEKSIVTEEVVDGVHMYSDSDDYVWPTDPLVLKKLEWFQDQKLALMMHWGPYSQLGLIESWALSDDDQSWSRADIDWTEDIETFKKQYFGLNKSFNPVRLMPKKWAKIAKEAGMRYLIFTTKHHDGFCMYDSKYTDYKTTDPSCPFHTHQHKDIVRSVFDAFREEGIGIGAYFSKADWHVDSYWHPTEKFTKETNRGPYYNPKDKPKEWQRFVEFTQNQIKELGFNYGDLDIMWFDAGWVCADNGQDIELGKVIDEIRTKQPGMLCADRTIGGPYENYITPEQCVPDEPLFVPWESCITLGNAFSYRFNDEYKSKREVICLLVDIVAKGGNLAINIAPQPDGNLPEGAIKSILGVGEWLKVYGDAIYGTRVCAPYKVDNIAFTKKGQKVFAIELFPEEGMEVKKEVLLPYTGNVTSIKDLKTDKQLDFAKTDQGYLVKVEDKADIARVFVLE